MTTSFFADMDEFESGFTDFPVSASCLDSGAFSSEVSFVEVTFSSFFSSFTSSETESAFSAAILASYSLTN